jgi:hypothetical protein
LELAPHQLIRFTDVFDDPHLPDEMRVIPLKTVSGGTELHIE